jgi:hypothetical protein
MTGKKGRSKGCIAWNRGVPAWNRGMPWPDEVKARISEGMVIHHQTHEHYTHKPRKEDCRCQMCKYGKKHKDKTDSKTQIV